MMSPPCKDCPDRYPACHDACEKYQKFRSERLKIYEENHRRHETDANVFLIEQQKKRHRKHQK